MAESRLPQKSKGSATVEQDPTECEVSLRLLVNSSQVSTLQSRQLPERLCPETVLNTDSVQTRGQGVTENK